MNDNINKKEPLPKYERVPLGKAIWNAKCVRCRKGDMFAPGIIGQKMLKKCSYCNLSYERHPGYFYVSMFASYAMSVAELVALGIATFVLSGGSENIYLYLGVILIAMILLSPFNFRYSRVFQMYFLDPGLKYEPEVAEKIHKEMISSGEELDF